MNFAIWGDMPVRPLNVSRIDDHLSFLLDKLPKFPPEKAARTSIKTFLLTSVHEAKGPALTSDIRWELAELVTRSKVMASDVGRSTETTLFTSVEIDVISFGRSLSATDEPSSPQNEQLLVLSENTSFLQMWWWRNVTEHASLKCEGYFGKFQNIVNYEGFRVYRTQPNF